MLPRRLLAAKNAAQLCAVKDTADTLQFEATQIAEHLKETMVDPQPVDGVDGQVCRSLARAFSAANLSPLGWVWSKKS